MINGRLNAQ
jgi:hypothetical protein